MRIGLDGLPLTKPKTGVGHYTFELARELALVEPGTSFELVYPSTYAQLSLPDTVATPSNLKLNRVPVGPLGRRWWSAGLPRYIRQEGIELFHGTNYDVPLWRRCATVLTIHDLSPLLYPETHTRRSVARARRRLPTMVRTADAIITPTESIRRDLSEHFRVPTEKIFAVPEAARACFQPMEFAETETVRSRLGVGDEFVLAVGTLEPRKNLVALIGAFEDVLAAKPNGALQLVIAGGAGWLSGPLIESIKNSPARDRIVLTNYLDDDALRALYASCRAFVYPSIYEGFGLPPLEAMACGAPVLISATPALAETSGGAALLFDPRKPADLARKLTYLLADETARLQFAESGRRRAAEFSWERTARETLKVYDQALSNFKSRAASARVKRAIQS